MNTTEHTIEQMLHEALGYITGISGYIEDVGYRSGDQHFVKTSAHKAEEELVDALAEVKAMQREIKRLQTALALAVGELSTHSAYSVWSPEQLFQQFLEEGTNG